MFNYDDYFQFEQSSSVKHRWENHEQTAKVLAKGCNTGHTSIKKNLHEVKKSFKLV